MTINIINQNPIEYVKTQTLKVKNIMNSIGYENNISPNICQIQDADYIDLSKICMRILNSDLDMVIFNNNPVLDIYVFE